MLLPLVASVALAAPDSAPDQLLGDPIPVADVLRKAKERVAEIQDVQRSVVEVQEATKRSRDVIKLNCINDRMLQFRGLITITDAAMGSLNEAVARHDEEVANHEYSRLGIVLQKTKVLAVEAQNCVGDDLSYIGPVQVTVEIDPSVPQKDVTQFDLPGLDTSRPPSASFP